MSTDGKDLNIDDVLSSINDKLIFNTIDADQLSYVKTRISRDVAKYMALRTRRETTKPFNTTDELMDALFKIYGDPSRRKNAAEAFRQIYQGNQDFNPLSQYVLQAKDAELYQCAAS